MNHLKDRKYARTIQKKETSEQGGDTEFSLSTTAALGILGGSFLVGLTAGCFLFRNRI